MKKQVRCIFVPGINMHINSKDYDEFEKCKNEIFSNSIILKKDYYFTEHDKVLNLYNELLEILRDGKPTELIAHSFGGIIAVAAYQKIKSEGINNVSKITTLASPHSKTAFVLKTIKEKLGYKYEKIDIPIITVGAYFDILVPFFLTKYPNSKHKLIPVRHNDFIFHLSYLRKKFLKGIL